MKWVGGMVRRTAWTRAKEGGEKERCWKGRQEYSIYTCENKWSDKKEKKNRKTGEREKHWSEWGRERGRAMQRSNGSRRRKTGSFWSGWKMKQNKRNTFEYFSIKVRLHLASKWPMFAGDGVLPVWRALSDAHWLLLECVEWCKQWRWSAGREAMDLVQPCCHLDL